MSIPIRIIQFLVAILFIISGLVKANDPLGLSYKMQEFFELWSSSLSAGHFFLKEGLLSLFDYLHAHSLFLSVAMISLEIVTGIALLLGWKKRFILYLLLALIVFFTFLTGYAYLSGKFTNCGCFGDCLPITPLTSFLKDVALLAMILLLILGQRFIKPLLRPATAGPVLLFSLLVSLGIQWYVLNYLPLADCLPFKKGNNIAQQMKPPAGSIPDSFAIRFIYEKNGKKYEFAPESLPADYTSYKYIDRTDKLVRKGNAEPAIKGFTLTGQTGEDSVQVVLDQPEALLLFIQEPGEKNEWLQDFKSVAKAATQKNIPVYVATSTPEKLKTLLIQNGIEAQVFACDFTIIRTAARTAPTLYHLKKGTIENKYAGKKLLLALDQISPSNNKKA